ncbi:unnamed protein product, partial [Closterium sp. NIES-54]
MTITSGIRVPLKQFRQWLDLGKGVAEVLVAVEKPKLKDNPVIPLSSISRRYGRGRGRGQGGGRFGGSNYNGGRGSGSYGNDNMSYGRGCERFD